MSRYSLLALLGFFVAGAGVFIFHRQAEGQVSGIRSDELTSEHTDTTAEEVKSPSLTETTTIDTEEQKTTTSNVVEEFKYISETIEHTEEEGRLEEERLHTEAESTLRDYAEDVLNAIQKSATSTPISPDVLEQIRAREVTLQEELKAVVERESKRLNEGVRTNNVRLRQESRDLIIAETQSKLREFTTIARERALQVERALYEARVKEAVQKFEGRVVANEIILKERVGLKLFRDTDKDGISDYDEENVYKTDPENFDTDGDKRSDGLEVQGGFNPREPRVDARIEHEDPRERGVRAEGVFRVESFEVTEVKELPDGKKDVRSAVVRGRALPNSFITIYIYSTPIVVTVKTDNSGRWTYTLDRELDDGAHDIFVAVTDHSGKILAKSEAFPFVKEAEAIVLITDEVRVSTPAARPRVTAFPTLIMTGAVSAALVLMGIITIGYFERKRGGRGDFPPTSSGEEGNTSSEE